MSTTKATVWGFTDSTVCVTLYHLLFDKHSVDQICVTIISIARALSILNVYYTSLGDRYHMTVYKSKSNSHYTSIEVVEHSMFEAK